MRQHVCAHMTGRLFQNRSFLRKPEERYERMKSRLKLKTSTSATLPLEAYSAFTHLSACVVAGSLETIRHVRGFDGFASFSAAPIATGWSDLSPGGNCTCWEQRTFARHTWTSAVSR